MGVMRSGVVALALAAGCGFSEPGDGVEDPSRFEVSWTFAAGLTCADLGDIGAAWVEVVLDDGSGEPDTEAFPCVDGAGITHAVADEVAYDVSLTARDPDYNPLGTSETQQAMVDTPGQVTTLPPFTIVPSDGSGDGSFMFTWTLESGVGNQITCAQAGAGGVQSVVTRAGTTQAVADIFPCEPGQAMTPLFPFDDYTVVVSVLDQADPPGVLASSMLRNATLDADVVDLGNFIFDIPGAAR
jgi:hypothetical protein